MATRSPVASEQSRAIVVESGKVEQVALDIQRSSLLKDLRTKFAIADAGANFHFWPDRPDRPDDFSALSHCDAVSAAQRCVWSEHAQNSFHALEVMLGIFEHSYGTRNKSPLQFSKTVTPHQEFPRRTARL